MADAEPGAASAEPMKKPRKSRSVVPSEMASAFIVFLRSVLSQLLAPEAVDKAIEKAQKTAEWKALNSKITAKAPKAKNEAGYTGAVRSGYQAFATLCMHFNACNMSDVGLFWRTMPEALKARFNSHMEALKAEVASRLAAGEQFTLTEALAALEARNNWRPLPWATLLQLREGGGGLDKYKLGPELLTGAAGVEVADDDDTSDDSSSSDGGDSSSSDSPSLSSSDDEVAKPAAAPAKPVAPAAKVVAPFKPPAAKPAAAAAAAPASPDKRKGAEGAAPAAKKHKKEKAAAAPAPVPATAEKKAKKHKKDKERN